MITIYRGSILEVKADAIVNASDKRLSGGGGIDKIIHRAAGKPLKSFLRSNYPEGIQTAEAIITDGFNVSRKIIHTAGPTWGKSVKKQQAARKELYDTYINCIELALEKSLESIAFPCISTGAYKFPKEYAANIAVNVAKQYEKDIHIIFVVVDNENYILYNNLLSH